MERSPPPRSIDASDWWRDEGKLNREGGLVEGEGRPMGRRDEVREGSDPTNRRCGKWMVPPGWMPLVGSRFHGNGGRNESTNVYRIANNGSNKSEHAFPDLRGPPFHAQDSAVQAFPR